MPISFANIPPNQLVPFFYAEVTSQAEPISPALRLLLVGTMNDQTAPGEASANKPYLLTDNNVKSYFGSGSMLESMYNMARLNAPYSEIWGIAINAGGGGTPAFSRMQVVSDASAPRSGTMKFYVGGVGVTVQVNADWTREQIRDQIVRRVNNNTALPVTAVKKHPVSGVTAPVSVLYLVCKWSGGTGNALTVSLRSPRGEADRLAIRLLSTENLSGGVGDVGPSDALAAIGDMEFDIFVSGSSTLGVLDAFKAELDDRWLPNRQLYGHLITARRDVHTGLMSLGDVRNDAHASVMGYPNTMQPPWEWASAVAGVVSVHWVAPPELSRPLQTLEIKGVYASWSDDALFTVVDRQQLLSNGISTFTVDNDGTCRIERLRTLRKFSDAGELDPSWADAITMFQTQYFVRFMRRAITAAFPRAALSTEELADVVNGFASPEQVRQVIIAAYYDLQEVGLVENADLFTDGLVVERHATDRTRVDAYMKPDFINQLRIVAALVETHLELIAEGQIAA